MDNDETAEEKEKFQKVFKLKKSTLFGDAIYAIHMNRQEKLRMPEEQADEDDVKALQTFICDTIKQEANGPQLAHLNDTATADGMQHLSNTLMTRQWLKQFLKYLAYKVKMLRFSKRQKYKSPPLPPTNRVNWHFGAVEKAKNRFSRWRPS